MKATLQERLDWRREIEDRIIEAGGEVNDEVLALLEDATQSVDDKFDAYAEVLQHLSGQDDSLKTEQEQIQARRRSIAVAEKNLRSRLTYAMEEMGEAKRKTSKHSYSVRQTESWSVAQMALSDTALMESLVETGWARKEYKPEIKTIKEAFAGIDVPDWVEIATKKSITIR